MQSPFLEHGNSDSIKQVLGSIDLQDFLNPNPVASFFLRVQGDAMRNAGIRSGDIVLVDRSLDPENNKIVVAALNGEFLIRWYYRAYHEIELLPGNPSFERIRVQSGDRLNVWGLVAAVIRREL